MWEPPRRRFAEEEGVDGFTVTDERVLSSVLLLALVMELKRALLSDMVTRPS